MKIEVSKQECRADAIQLGGTFRITASGSLLMRTESEGVRIVDAVRLSDGTLYQDLAPGNMVIPVAAKVVVE